MSRKKLVMLGKSHKMFNENPYSDYMSMSFIINISYSGKDQRYSEFTRIKYSFYHNTITLSLYMAAYYDFFMNTTERFENLIQNY